MTRTYERLGWRYLILMIALGWAESLATTFVTALWGSRYLGFSLSGHLDLLLIGEACVLAGLVVGLIISLEGFQPLREWERTGKGEAMAPEVWRSILRFPFTLINRSAITVSLCSAPTIWAVIAGNGLPPVSAIPITAGLGMTVALVWVLTIYSVEVGLRPVVQDIAQRLPAGFEPGAPIFPLGRKILIPALVLTVYTAAVVGAFADGTSGAGRLAGALAIAVLTTGIVAMVGYRVVTSSILDPLNALAGAARKVQAGNLAGGLPVVTADELGNLTGRFNQMVAGLRERESLRGENTQLVDELRASRTRIVAAADAERQAVERDLHDGAQQYLVLLDLKLGLARKAAQGDPEAVARIDEARADLSRALSELRDLAHGIYPQVLTSDGLAGALREAGELAPVSVAFEAGATRRYRPEIEAAVYFCCVEALQNAAKHAGEGSRVTVSLEEDGGSLRFEVADDGPGFDPASVNGSAGLQNMADRIGALGGELRLDAQPGEGTRVIGAVPVSG